MDKLIKPKSPYFSSGPCKKYCNKNQDIINTALLNRSCKSRACIKRINYALELTKKILNIPLNYRLCIVPGSDTGAIEIAIWNFLGCNPIDIFECDYFSKEWKHDIINELNLKNTRVFEGEYGKIPNLHMYNPDNDCIFVYNATTSGVCINNLDWIPKDRNGITICDMTSIIFGIDIDWDKLDITTFSWQKVLGGEAGLGVMIISPRAYERLNNYNPLCINSLSKRPIPRLFRLKDSSNNIKNDLFNGVVINTISMLLVEDYIYALKWVELNGGIEFIKNKIYNNYLVIENFIKNKNYIDFICSDKSIRSKISVCLYFTNSKINIDKLLEYLENNKIAYDIKGHKSSKIANIRIWCGPTIDNNDLNYLMKYIEYYIENILRLRL